MLYIVDIYKILCIYAFFFYKMDIRQCSFKFNLGNIETGC